MKAFYAGSFDPFTNGHLHVVQLAAQIFDEVIVGIGENPTKKRYFEVAKMKQAIETTIQAEGLASKVTVITYQGLTAAAAKDRGAKFLVRGLRNGSDYDFEENLALLNQEIAGLETIYLRAGKTAYVSSSAVRELVANGQTVDHWVPIAISQMIAS